MKGNEKISFTAEAIALMRAEKKSDRYSHYFVSNDIKNKYKIIPKLIPRKTLDKIFLKRINLSRELDKIIKTYNPTQIIELAAGYSPRGLIATQKSANLNYIETDFPSLIENKKSIITSLIKNKEIKSKRNHHLIPLDSLDKNFSSKLKPFVKKDRKTLIIAETLTSYLNEEEHEFMIKNINNFLDNFKESAYLSHETNRMISGFFGKALLFYRDKIAKTKSYRHFKTQEDIKRFFEKHNFKLEYIKESKKTGNFFYLVSPNKNNFANS